ncbi:STAS domain-containing protein [Nonomuraea sp. K274]|uniref:STAS domain-containing protein n=1 Tax=Nonomuraea cypriaca TaxID=1187855 RepID=A0A931A9C1_9ACTN|nr:STAS domain-containing protein [Nonomuraea cypriaca]MBF8187618.1 STAS domain-containing protein [Nonomuraea cypriaca]
MSDVEDRLLYQDEQLKITVRAALEAPAVTLIGEIDATNSPALASALVRCREREGEGDYIVVDTGRLTFIDLSGLRVLVMPTLPPAQRWIRLHNVTPYQRRLLRMMGWYAEARTHGLPR